MKYGGKDKLDIHVENIDLEKDADRYSKLVALALQEHFKGMWHAVFLAHSQLPSYELSKIIKFAP